MSETLTYKIYRLRDKGASHHAALMYAGLKQRGTLNEANFEVLAEDLGMKRGVTAVHPIARYEHTFFPRIFSTIDGMGFIMFSPLSRDGMHFVPKDAELVEGDDARLLHGLYAGDRGQQFALLDPDPKPISTGPTHLVPKGME